jgi:hypothetical protein
MDAKLKDLVEQYPNDMELGSKVRELYWENLSRLEKLQKEMEGKFIYESPDGGKTVYQRPFGGDISQRTLVK